MHRRDELFNEIKPKIKLNVVIMDRTIIVCYNADLFRLHVHDACRMIMRTFTGGSGDVTCIATCISAIIVLSA